MSKKYKRWVVMQVEADATCHGEPEDWIWDSILHGGLTNIGPGVTIKVCHAYDENGRKHIIKYNKVAKSGRR